MADESPPVPPKTGASAANLKLIDGGKPPKEKQPSAKQSMIDLAGLLTGIMNRSSATKNHPAFPHDYILLNDNEGKRITVEDTGKGVLERRSLEAVETDALQYCQTERGGIGRWKVDASDVTKLIAYWRMITVSKHIDSISPILFKDQPGYCWSRLDVEIAPGPTPTFDELFSRMRTNRDAIRAWIWSIFEPKSELQDYVWIYGEGNDGKGRLNNWLRHVIGKTYSAQTVPKGETRFFAGDLVGKRLAAYADCNEYNFVTTSLFKSLTGGDPQKTERKGQDSFTIMLYCKHLFLSNKGPGISSSKHDTRRAIVTSIDTVPDENVIPTSQYDQLLIGETPAFLHKCRAMYSKLCPDLGRIPKDIYSMDTIATENESQYHYLFDKYTIPEAGAWLSSSELHDCFNAERIPNQYDQKKYKEFMAREYGAVFERRTVDEGQEKVRQRGYTGIRLSETGITLLGKQL